jgi:transcription initiation factor IIE alpha subunit
MGTNFMFKCKNCGYQVMSSGGLDYGMVAVVQTYRCKSCKEIVDVCVGEYSQTYTREEAKNKNKDETNLDFYVCPECMSGKSLVKWNKRKRPCPKCGEKLEKSVNSEIIMWD